MENLSEENAKIIESVYAGQPVELKYKGKVFGWAIPDRNYVRDRISQCINEEEYEKAERWKRALGEVNRICKSK